MIGHLLPALSALGLGVLSFFHPCPLATNLAGISLLCGWARGKRGALAAGLAYAAGRAFVYAVLGMAIALGALAVPSVAGLMRYYANRLLGPFLVLAGMLLSGLIRAPEPWVWRTRIGRWARARPWGASGGFLLGALLAASFCPASAGLFFGVLIPLAISHGSSALLPTAYGIGTGVPALCIAMLFSKGTVVLGRKIKDAESLGSWFRKGAGWALTAVGIYYTLHHVYQLV